MGNLTTRWRRTLSHLAIGAALASFAAMGAAKSDPVGDTDTITNIGNVPLTAHVFACAAVAAPAGSSWVPSAFSFDISWVDPYVHGYFLSDRSNNGVTPSNGGMGDVLFLDLDTHNVTFFLPPADDPMAGMGCDQNTAFGGTTGVGRNEITGPNGNFTVHDAEVWVGDGPSAFQPGQGHGAVTMSGAGTCGVDGVTCSYAGLATDYAADQCNSSVRVFDIATGKQTDHIDIGGCFRTDEGSWDPVDDVVLIANPTEQNIGGTGGSPNYVASLNHSPFVTLIDARPVPAGQHHKILKQINFDGTNGTPNADGGIEQSVYAQRTGMFYVAMPSNSTNYPGGAVVVVDPEVGRNGDTSNIKVTNIFPLTGCNPNGAVLRGTYELLLGCSSGPEQIIDIQTGVVEYTITQTSGGCDEVAFNAGDNHFLGACTDSNNPGTDNLDITDGIGGTFDQAINTHALGAHSVAADPVTITDYMPANDGLCGTNPCILIFGPTGKDDLGEDPPVK